MDPEHSFQGADMTLMRRRRVTDIEEGFIQEKDLFKRWTELIQFLAALPILHQDDLQKRMNLSYSSIHPILQLVLYLW